MSFTHTQLKIAIVGAGLGGLALARTLQQNDIQCTVYELETSPNARVQGGSLDMNPKTGQTALRTNGIWEKLGKDIRFEGDSTLILDKHGKVWIDEKAENTAQENLRPEIDRGVMRQLYLDSLQPGTIRWGSKVSSIETHGSQHTLIFADGAKETFDFVVGADGAWSKIRTLLTDVKPTYAGIVMVEARLHNVDGDHPTSSKLVGLGSMLAVSDNKGLMAQRDGENTIRNYITLRIPENSLPEKEFQQEDSAKEYLVGQFPDWSEDLRNLIRDAQGIIPRYIYAFDPEHSWTSVPGCTLVGDAAHLMSPFAGEGANLALIDGVDLGQAIVKVVKNGEKLASTQKAFEEAMLARSQEAAFKSAMSLQYMIAEDTPRSAMALFAEFMPEEAMKIGEQDV